MTETRSTDPAATVQWQAVDADERWPGRWTAHVTSIQAHGRTYAIRVTPGDHHTYLAPGFCGDIDGGYGKQWAIRTRTLAEALRRAVEDVLR